MWSLWGHQGGMGSPPMFLRELGRDSKVRSPRLWESLEVGLPSRAALPQPLAPIRGSPFPRIGGGAAQNAKAHLFGSSLVAKGYQSWLWLSL